MTKNNSLLLPVFAVGAAILLFSKEVVEQFADSITISSVKYRNFKLKVFSIQFDMEFDVMNPTVNPLVIERIAGTIFYNGTTELGTLDTSFPQETIGSGQNEKIVVEVEAPTLNILGTVLTQVLNGFDLPDMKITGFAYSKGVGIPFSKSILRIG